MMLLQTKVEPRNLVAEGAVSAQVRRSDLKRGREVISSAPWRTEPEREPRDSPPNKQDV